MKHLFGRKPRIGFSAFVFCGLSIAFMLLDYHYKIFDPLRSKVAFVTQPLYFLVDTPFRWISSLKSNVQRFDTLLKAYEQLQSTQQRDAVRLQRFSALELENRQLRALLKSTEGLSQPFMMAEILQVHTDDLLSQRIVLNRGANDGVVLGQAVIDGTGVLGEIIEVYSRSSRAILLSDAGYGIPVQNTRSGLIGIVAGNGLTQPLILQHVPNTIEIEVGDQLVTSGLEGRYPAGYAVGTISMVSQAPGEPFAHIEVKPSADYRLVRHVLLVQNTPKSES